MAEHTGPGRTESKQTAPGEPSRLIIELRRIRANMLPEVGGKAANLGELIWAGLPVPPGFCLTTEAYRRALQPGGGLESAFTDIFRDLETVDPGDLEELASLAARARDTVLDAGIPADVEDAVRSAYAALGPESAVAVRSSATAEDLPFASFAGQQDTYLNVVGADAVLQSVRKCWASLWTDRAVSYRASNGIDHAAVTLAVVVQRMVDVETAGVLFTANPVTGRRREAVIDANPGLGEAVVSGAVNPDHFVVDSLTGRITERRIGDRKLVIRSLPGGGTERVDSTSVLDAAGPAGVACLSDSQIRALAVLGQRVEDHYRAPQDTEWAIDGDGKLWLTQARPITTLYPQMTRQPAIPGPHAYLCFSLAQGLTRPLTPMGLAGIRLMGSSVARAAGFRVVEPRTGPSPYYEAGQRIYFDLTAVFRSEAGRAIVPRIFDVMEARSAAVMRVLFDDPRFAVTSRTPFKLIRHVAPILLRFRVPETLVRALFRPNAALGKVERVGENLKAALEIPANATARERLDHAERILGEELFPMLPNMLPPVALGFGMMGLVRKLLGEQASWGELQTIIRGLPNNVTTEMDLALWRLATSIRDDAAAAEVFTGDPPALAESYRDGGLPVVAQSGLAAFLRDYGHRAIAEIDMGLPRWSEDPTHIIGVLVNYLRLDNTRLAPDKQFEKAAHDAEEQVAVLVARARSKSPLHARIVKMALERTRMFAGLRELPKYNLVLAFSAVRAQLGLVGETLAEAGVIDDAGDVFFLDFDDAHRGLDGEDLRAMVAQRREDYELELRRRHVPRVLLSDGTEPEALPSRPRPKTAAPTSDGALLGTPASAGTVTAVARVITDPVGAHLEPGEILVAPSTDPGWTPLFLTAGGLVMEMGGPNSHGAVVAREYGIPAVVGVPDATSRISSGQTITVDGATGTVVL
ncbi:PEP/pyruvate-binding domain-containing protein [Arthrobacter sp. AZCC_0090]|uniref:PEP/pyruvate-binding domain-containing protein n=1 Tax=Arthrobacter sp. AZCC_0090 TaxID=2735881 RepID=UPI00160D2C60|nr:PEP/pyruvate-binding domain-containing protein [Arthrobacter sp. AZCC_0090]MBB6406721.1 pyruvate,water dikinase [Arthrobacter sp. AZCC_0090]